jgi:hypothetical protein
LVMEKDLVVSCPFSYSSVLQLRGIGGSEMKTGFSLTIHLLHIKLTCKHRLDCSLLS